MRKIYAPLFSFLFLLACTAPAQVNFTLLGHLTYPVDLSNLWGWDDGAGHEYAIVGTYDGTSIVDISDPTAPVEVQFIDGDNSIWRQMGVWSHYAYVCNESGGGLLCIDLSGLPSSVTYNFTNAGIGLNTAHTIYCDENGVVHVFGSNVYSGGDVMLDAATNPMDPPFLGAVDEWYVHHGFARGDTLWASNIYQGWFSVWDISDKTSPVEIGQQTTPGGFTHDVILSDDDHYLFSTDEITNGVLASYDVSDLGDITELDEFRANPGTNSIPHYTWYLNGFLITAWYRDGVIITDAHHPENLIKTGYYDTSPLSGDGFNGAWGVMPYLPSGVVIVSDIENGLFVLQPTYQPACYLQGTVTDASTGSTLYDVSITVSGLPDGATTTNLSGLYYTGTVNAGSYDVTFAKTGYSSLTVSGVNLSNGVVTVQDAALEPLTPFPITGQVIDAGSGEGVAYAKVEFDDSLSTYTTSTDGSGNYTIPGIYEGSYTMYGGAWGFVTHAQPETVNMGGTYDIVLNRGYYDDFFFNFNWLTTGTAATGLWEMGEPIGTTNGSSQANPEFDVPDDYGVNSYVTGNGGGDAGTDDVDDGTAILTSPPMNLSAYSDPYVSYSRWFYDGGGVGTPNDTLNVFISNGMETVLADQITHTSPYMSMWVHKTWRVSDYVPPTANVSVSFYTADQMATGHVVEAGLDKFYVFDSISTPPVAAIGADNIEGCTPFTVHFEDASTNSPSTWSWSFPGGFPSSSSFQNPTVTYATPGTYDVTLIAGNALGSDTIVQTAYVTVHESPALSTSTGAGTATVSVTGGAPPYDISWNDPSHQTTETAMYLSPGVYTVTVTDANGCVVTTDVEVMQGDAVQENALMAALQVTPDPFTTHTTLRYFATDSHVQITLSDVTGRALGSWNMQPGLNAKTFGDDLPAGMYFINIKKDDAVVGSMQIVKSE